MWSRMWCCPKMLSTLAQAVRNSFDNLCNRCRCRIEPLSRQVIVLFQASNLSSSEVSRLDFVLSESGRLFRASQFHQRDPCEIFLWSELSKIHCRWILWKDTDPDLRDPAIVIRKDSITFNTACITGLEDVVYVHVMFNNDLKRIVVRGCDEMTRTLCVGAWQNRISAKAGRCPASHLRL